MRAVLLAVVAAVGLTAAACTSSTRATDAPAETAVAPGAVAPGAVAPGAAAPPAAAVGAAAPAFTLVDQTGRSVSLGDYAGKVVVLEWVNPDCPSVQRHAKARTMAALAEKYGGDVAWLAVNSTNYMDAEDNRKWAEKNGLSYPILDDQDGRVARAFGARTTPHMYVIDREGRLAYQGAIDDDPSGDKPAKVNYVDRALGELVAGKAVSAPQTKPYGCSVKYSD
jgi:peroxiredoxin